MISRNQAKLIRKLGSRKHRDAEGLFLVEGVRLVEALLAAAWPVELAVCAPSLVETQRGRELADAIERAGWPRTDASDPELARLAQTDTPQGVLVVVRRRDPPLSEFEPGSQSAVLVFDRVGDPGNLGTLVRTAHALGVDWTVALPGTVDPWNPKAVRASAGSSFHVPVTQETWQVLVGWLRDRDFHILCADPSGETVARDREVPPRFALVLGSEPSGLEPDIERACDQRVAVHLAAEVDSLNVAIAGALLLDRLLAKRQPAAES